jgi:hypothetical protein
MFRSRCVVVGGVAILGLVGYATPVRADVCDLSSRNTCLTNGAYYSNVLATGTFTIDPFLQMKTTGSTTTTEQGYNTAGDADPSTGKKDYQFDQSGSTRALQLSEIPLSPTIGSMEYREFLLNITEPDSGPDISLDQLQIFLSSSNNLTSYDTTTRTLNGLTAVYDLDAGGTDNWIKLNYNLVKSTGPGAMIVYIPNYLFTQSGGQYVYVYSQFGSQLAANNGMEEWWIRSSTGSRTITRVPEPGTLLLFGTASVLAGLRLRRRFR